MRPNTGHKPSGLAKLSIGVNVALAIRVKFGRPPVRIGLWIRLVDRAAVPKAAVDEHCYPRSDEHDVGPPSNARQNGPIDAIMVASDPHANQVAAALRLFGKIPNKDIDIVGYDHTWAEEPSRIWEAVGPLATVDKRCDRICQELAALVLDRIDGRLPELPQRRVVEGEFIDLSGAHPQRAIR